LKLSKPIYRIRQAATDEEVWLDMTVRLWPEATTAELKEDFHRILSSEEDTVLLCKEDGQVVGMAVIALRHDYVEGTTTTPVGYIEGIFVREECRGRKAGQHLVEAAEK
jgi:aminoglycoside 6'-N-acetyltransferase I